MMHCGKCNKDLADCECSDFEERMTNLMKPGMSLDTATILAYRDENRKRKAVRAAARKMAVYGMPPEKVDAIINPQGRVDGPIHVSENFGPREDEGPGSNAVRSNLPTPEWCCAESKCETVLGDFIENPKGEYVYLRMRSGKGVWLLSLQTGEGNVVGVCPDCSRTNFFFWSPP